MPIRPDFKNLFSPNICIKIIGFSALFISFSLEALPLDRILKANDAKSLRRYVKERDRQAFLKILCKQQKSRRKPPTACYELPLPADPYCLNLKAKDLSLEILGQALQSSFLSPLCRERLKDKQKLLLYRRKDFLLPELKNYWTAQKPFFYKKRDASLLQPSPREDPLSPRNKISNPFFIQTRRLKTSF